MSDDIVTRLRQEWEYGNNAKGCDYEMFAQAADEIERLRAERDEWREYGQVHRWDRDRWRRIADGLHHKHRIVKFGDYGVCLKCEARHAYRKARREEAESACGNAWCDSYEVKPGKEQCSYEGSALCDASAPCMKD